MRLTGFPFLILLCDETLGSDLLRCCSGLLGHGRTLGLGIRHVRNVDDDVGVDEIADLEVFKMGGGLAHRFSRHKVGMRLCVNTAHLGLPWSYISSSGYRK